MNDAVLYNIITSGILYDAFQCYAHSSYSLFFNREKKQQLDRQKNIHPRDKTLKRKCQLKISKLFHFDIYVHIIEDIYVYRITKKQCVPR